MTSWFTVLSQQPQRWLKFKRIYFEQWVRGEKLVKSQLFQIILIFWSFSKDFWKHEQLYKVMYIHIERERLIDGNKCNYKGGHNLINFFYITLIILPWDLSTLCIIVCVQLYYVPHMACSAIFGLMIREGILFSWFCILGSSLTSVRLNPSVCHGSLDNDYQLW